MSFSAVTEVLEQGVREALAPGAAAVVTGPAGPLYEGSAGAASAALAMRADTVFRIASMTKPITTVAVMMLAEEGRLTLDDPLARHLPGFEQPPVLVAYGGERGGRVTREAARPVRIRDLLSHTSGFGYWFLERALLAESKGQFLSAPFLMHDPGERFSYGIGTDVLGLIFEPLTGQPLAQFIAERVTGPLGMADTRFAPPADRERLAALYRRHGDAFAIEPVEARGDAPRGGGGLYSTIGDYAALMRFFLNRGVADDGRRLLSAASIDAITTNQIGDLFVTPQRSAYPARTLNFAFIDGTQKFGLNMMIETRRLDGARSAGSYGWAGIYNTWFWVDPVARLGAALMMQVSPFCDEGCLALLRRFERAVYSAWPASARTVAIVSASAADLSSRYRSTRANRSASPPGYRRLT